MATEAPPPPDVEPPRETVFDEGSGYAPAEALDLPRPAIQRPMVLVALAYLAGILWGRWFLLPVAALASALAAIVLICGFTFVRHRRRRLAVTGGWMLLVALGLLGWLASNHAIRLDRHAKDVASGFTGYQLTRVEGIVAEPPRAMGGSTAIVLDDVTLASAPAGPGQIPMTLKLSVMVRGGEWGKYVDAASNSNPDSETTMLAYTLVPGTRIAAWGRVDLPEGPSRPGDFDEAHWLKSRAIAAELNVRSPGNVERLNDPSGLTGAVQTNLHRVRSALRANLRRALPGEAYGLAAGLLLGEKQSLGLLTREAFNQVGLAHLLSVSGLHTGFALLIAFGLVRLTFLPVRWWWIFLIAALWTYAALVGFRPPVVRAAIMGSFLLVGWRLGRTTPLLAALATSAFFTLLIDPRNIVRIDWQLSYMCVLSLVLFVPMLQRFIPEFISNLPARFKRWIPGVDLVVEPDSAPDNWRFTLRRFLYRYAYLPLLVVFAIQMGTLPLQVTMFGELSPVAFVANVLAVPLAFVIVLLSASVSALASVPLIGPALAGLLAFASDLLLRWVDLLDSLPIPPLLIPALPPLVFVAYYAFLFLGPHLRRTPIATIVGFRRSGFDDDAQAKDIARWRRHAFARIAVFLLLLAWLPLLGRPAGGVLELYALDVGQGDALVLRLPDGRVAVIDGGGGFGPGHGRTTVEPFLRRLGVHRIELLVVTHADADHVGGLDYLLDRFDVGLVLHGPDTADTDAYRELQEAVARRGVRTVQARAGERLRGLGPVEALILNPFPSQSDNDASVVLLIDYRDVELLLTGDIEAPAERRILASGLARDVEVLKVAHHGSRSSTTDAFLEATAPELAIVSAGRGNRFGHPAPVVLDRLERRGARIARTDLHGTIRVRTDGRRFTVDHFGDFARADAASR